MKRDSTIHATRQTAPCLLLSLAAASVLAGCSSFEVTPATPEAVVQQRAQTRWSAHIAGNWETVYSFATPSYRALRSLTHYRGTMGGAATWKSAEVVAVECAEAVCTARVRVDFQPALRSGAAQEISTYFDEKWVQEDGQWFFHPRR